eukprot:30893-Pelagococcus_subviridis.AAC.14
MSPMFGVHFSPISVLIDNSGTIASTAPAFTTASTFSLLSEFCCVSFDSSASVRTSCFRRSLNRSSSGSARIFILMSKMSFTNRK